MAKSRSRLPLYLITFLGILLLAAGLSLAITAATVHFLDKPAESSADAPPPAAPHIDLSDFHPGYIISDRVMYDYQSMSLHNIESFIQEHNAGCRSGDAACLGSFTEDTADIPASERCQGYSGHPGETAAQIIYKTAQSCRINPQVLLVLLQKEQGLLTASSATLTTQRYQTATGYGCPDGQACDAQYFGFTKQVYHAAAQFQRYRQLPRQFPYREGRTYQVAFSPSTACGSAPITMQNQATAGLYNYTPYQPDSALLSGMPGECSSYGNANFFGIFKDWFGDPRR